MTTTALTGDRYLEKLVPSAEKLIHAVREGNQLAIDAMFADAEQLYGDPLTGARALSVLLAAIAADDRPAEQALLWRRNRIEYLRLRNAGVGADEAALLSSQISSIRKGAVA